MTPLTLQKIIERISLMTSYEAITAIIACLLGVLVGQYLAKIARKIIPKSMFTHFLQLIANIIPSLITLFFLFICLFTLLYLKEKPILTLFFTKISIAWFVTALTLLLTSRRSARWIIIVFVIPITVLSLFGIWTPLANYLDGITFTEGKITVSLYQIFKTIFIFIILTRIAKFITSFGEARLQKMNRLKTSDRTLILKTIQIATYFVITLISLDLLGVDIATLTVFSGAIGVGLGFGLQKVTSNFISGIILLLEKSVEIGDLVELSDGTNGIIKRTAARYTLIENSQGKEVLIPNEDFITQRVTNWTYSNHKGRVEIPINISYNSDLDLACKLILEAASNHQHCLKDPEPQCFMQVFAENSVSFLLMFWIDDIVKGKSKPQSEIMFEIWRKFKENNIEMPYPQRDLHIKEPIRITNV